MVVELAEQTSADAQAEWICGERSRILCEERSLYDHCVLDFKRLCSVKLERLGDVAIGAERYDDAVSQYSAAIPLDPAAPEGLFIKRSKAYLAIGRWEDALNDANEVCSFVLSGLGPFLLIYYH